MEVEIATNKIQDLKAELSDIIKQIVSQNESRKLLKRKIKYLLNPLMEVVFYEKLECSKNVDGQERLASTMLPKEMWTEIFSHLSDPADIQNTNMVCSTFNDILNPRKTTWLFCKVIGILSKFLDTSDLLLCRKICKKWKLDVDDFILRDRHRYQKLLDWTFLKNNDGITEKFTQQLLNSRNPFTMKAVSIDDGRNSQPNYYVEDEIKSTQFWHRIKLLLDIYGSRVSYLNFYTQFLSLLKLPTKTCTSTDLIRRQLLHYLPNLQVLKINGSQSLSLSSIYKRYEMMELPELEKLEELALNVGEAEKILLRAFISKYSKQLKILNIDTHDNSLNGFLIASKFDWPNLVELEMRTVEMDLINSVNLKAFPNLVKLSLNVNDDGDDKDHLQDILLIVNELVNVARNFVVLTLRVSKLFSIKEVENLPIDLYASERLKTLKINMGMFWSDGNEYYHFSFLLRFPFIKYLHISGFTPMRPVQIEEEHGLGEEVVEVYKFQREGKMYESNIWKLLPCLKFLEAFRKEYKRLNE